MDTISFSFKGNIYTAYLVINKSEYPHFYWCFLNDSQLIKDLGDCITFQIEKRGSVLEATDFYSANYRPLITAIKEVLIKYKESPEKTYTQ